MLRTTLKNVAGVLAIVAVGSFTGAEGKPNDGAEAPAGIVGANPSESQPQGTTPKPRGGGPVGAPLADEGATSAFSYFRSPDYRDSYVVVPRDGTASYLVSESFLGLVLHRGLDDERRLVVLSNYKNMVLQANDLIMAESFPTSSSPGGEPFATRTLYSQTGMRAVIEQDALAPPYVRVTLTADKKTTEFSLVRSVVEQLLNNPHLTDGQRIDALKTFGLRLPEEARANFKNLTAEKIREMASNSPALQENEYIRMSRILRQSAKDPAGQRPPRNVRPEMPFLPVASIPHDAPTGTLPTVAGPAASPPTSVPKAAVVNRSESGVGARTIAFFALALTGIPIIVVLRRRRSRP